MQISYLADVPQLARGLIPGLLEHWRFAFPDDTEHSRALRLKAHENRDHLPIAWIAHSEEGVLGTAALRASDLHGREDLGPWLGGVYVLPAFRRRGVASALCAAVESKTRAMGIRRLYLFTLDQAPLYARLGWREWERAVWQDHDCVIMSKEL
jgi:N-acetylglutamate synthase-like GNAT family acetyltransferase